MSTHAPVMRSYGSSVKICGAKTRGGTPCQRKLILRGGRCPNHGGLSVGPRTPEGREQIAEAQRRRWVIWRARRADKLD
jgi:hypothetical protein